VAEALLHCAIFHNAVVKQVARELHNATVVATDVFMLRIIAHSVARSTTHIYIPQRIAATCDAIAQCITPPTTFIAIFESRTLQTHARIIYFL